VLKPLQHAGFGENNERIVDGFGRKEEESVALLGVDEDIRPSVIWFHSFRLVGDLLADIM
jgi:hypothetical protein